MDLPSALSSPVSPQTSCQRRSLLMNSSSCTFVDLENYTELVLSHRSLERADDDAARLCGLRDLNTGELFYIESERLFS